jgi:hypothetical protein
MEELNSTKTFEILSIATVHPERATLPRINRVCSAAYDTTSEYSTMYHELPRAARFWSVLFVAQSGSVVVSRPVSRHPQGRVQSGRPKVSGTGKHPVAFMSRDEILFR